MNDELLRLEQIESRLKTAIRLAPVYGREYVLPLLNYTLTGVAEGKDPSLDTPQWPNHE